jgi:hypothetical protein
MFGIILDIGLPDAAGVVGHRSGAAQRYMVRCKPQRHLLKKRLAHAGKADDARAMPE